MTNILGPLPCVSCRKPVWWDRVGDRVRLMETARRPHECSVRRLAQLATKIAA